MILKLCKSFVCKILSFLFYLPRTHPKIRKFENLIEALFGMFFKTTNCESFRAPRIVLIFGGIDEGRIPDQNRLVKLQLQNDEKYSPKHTIA
jgi:hypothetical protein